MDIELSDIIHSLIMGTSSERREFRRVLLSLMDAEEEVASPDGASLFTTIHPVKLYENVILALRDMRDCTKCNGDGAFAWTDGLGVVKCHCREILDEAFACYEEAIRHAERI